MSRLSIGNTITIEDLLKYGPLGLELEYDAFAGDRPTKVVYDLALYNSRGQHDRACAEEEFTECFPTLEFVPGFLLQYQSGVREPVMSAWWYIIRKTKISKLPKLKLLKRKEI